jgi:2-polyprenyl-3-methyl-5-hydroxy-6-metoxy-1,4-benzoquinol methylase
MRWRLTPTRRRGVEILDDPATPSDVRERSMGDIASSNALFGGMSSVLEAVAHVVPTLGAQAALLDVGTGLADIPARARQLAGRAGVQLTAFGVDFSESVLRSARHRVAGAVVADARRLPIADRSADIVTCSQLLHHFEEGDARQLLAELNRVSRGWVVLSDLRRSWFAAAGFWIASIVLRFHAVTRHDGVTSVLRGFTADELEALVIQATGITPLVRHGVFWRLSATWRAQR